MATKSMLKDVEIKDKKFGQDFSSALEVALRKAESDQGYEPMKREHRELSGEEVKDFLNL